MAILLFACMIQQPPQTQQTSRLVLVDTCSLVRLYYTDVKPIAGRTVAQYQIMTLETLANEVRGLASGEAYAWLSVERLNEIHSSIFKLTSAQATSIETRRKRDQPNWQLSLDAYCQSKGTTPRITSRNDGFALAAAIEHKAILVTDEWPLKWIAENFDYDDGSPIDSLLSVDVLALLEQNSVIDDNGRRQTYRSWRMAGESLHAASDRRYWLHFRETAPNAQN